MYNKRGGGDQFRKFNSVNLAWWHTYKHASLLIWRRFAPTIFAPLWHNLYPAGIFPIKPSRLVSITTHLMYMFLAYPMFKPELDALKEEDLSPVLGTMRDDIVFMMEFAIPVVNHAHVFCSANNIICKHKINSCLNRFSTMGPV
jgi:hypothetical protein